MLDAEVLPPVQHNTEQVGHGVTDKQFKRMWAIMKTHGWTVDGLRIYVQDMFNVSDIRSISRKEYDLLCDKVLPAGPVSTPQVGVDQDPRTFSRTTPDFENQELQLS